MIELLEARLPPAIALSSSLDNDWLDFLHASTFRTPIEVLGNRATNSGSSTASGTTGASNAGDSTNEAVGASAVGTRLSQSSQQLLPLLQLVRPAGEDLGKG
jgi:hypothetical protein